MLHKQGSEVIAVHMVTASKIIYETKETEIILSQKMFTGNHKGQT